jgi:hypothetical protein
VRYGWSTLSLKVGFMTFKVIAIASLAYALLTVACGDDDDSKADAQPRRNSDAGQTKDADTAARANYTSAACGETPLLSDHVLSSPGDCIACVESSCCAEAKKCSDDGSCKRYRECFATCDASDGRCLAACYQDNSPGDTNSALFNCEVGCAACLDLSCAGKPWKKATAASHDMNVLALTFTTNEPVANATIKVCEPADSECEHPSQQAVTKSDGSALLSVPAAAGGTDAYLDVTADNFVSVLYFFHRRTVDLTGITTVPLLDTKTGDSLTKLAGGTTLTDSNYGSLIVSPTSCDDTGLPGAAISSSHAGPDAVTSYLIDGVPSLSATKTGPAAIGEIVSHAPGKTTAKVMYGDKVLATTEVIVRTGYETIAIVPPGE